MKKQNAIMVAIGAVVAVAGGLFFFNRKKKNGHQKETPPKGTPQLNIHNPGNAHEFPKSASESEIG